MKSQIKERPKAVEEAAAREFDRRYEAVMLAYDRHDPLLRSYVSSRIQNLEDVKDFLQDFWKNLLLRAPLEKIDRLPWLLRRVKWRIGDYYDRRKRLAERETSVEHIDRVTDEAAPLRELEDSPEADVRLREQFFENFPDLDLTDTQQDVLWLYGRHGLTVQEISDQMNIPSSTVHDWISRARKQLKPYLES